MVYTPVLPVASPRHARTARADAVAAAAAFIAGPTQGSSGTPRSHSPSVAGENEINQNRDGLSGLRISGQRSGLSGATSPSHADPLGSTFSTLGATIGSPPRHVIIRSLVQMQRTATGPSAFLPNEDYIRAGSFESSIWATAGPGPSSGAKPHRQLRYAGSGSEKVPIELVTCPDFRPSRVGPVKTLRRTAAATARQTKVIGKLFGVSKTSGGDETEAEQSNAAVVKASKKAEKKEKRASPARSPCGEASHASSTKAFRQKEVKPLTHELRTDIKTQLDSLLAHCRPENVCRTPSVSTARTIVGFFKILQHICDMMGNPLAEKAYRHAYTYELLHALTNLWEPELLQLFSVELSGCSGTLPSVGYLAFMVLVPLMEVPWTFTYNSLTHKLCTCRTTFPGTTKCLVPADGHPGQTLDSRLVANLASSFAARAPGAPLNLRALYARIDAFRRQERHFPVKLTEMAAAVSEHFLSLSSAVPLLVEEFDQLPLNSSFVLCQSWERFVGHFVSEVNVFDRVYTMFEKLCLELADRMIGIALEPVKGMTGPSSSLVCKPGDPFKPFETAVLCQRLGLLKQQVNFGGPHHLVHFDPHVLSKAQRVMMMSTYEEVRNMAHAMLTQFNSLCSVLVKLTDSQIQPELQDNNELREAVVSLEAIWAECQFVLQQDVLDFIQLFLDYTPRLGGVFRAQLYLAMHSEESTSATPEAQETARKIFFETLPILMYLDELWRDIKVQRGEGSKDLEAGYAGCAFRDLFCRKSERHHMLRRDFAKFDEQRFAKFRSFLLGDHHEDDDPEGGHLQSKYFQNVYRQLREVAAFPTGESPSEAMRVATRLQTQVCMEPLLTGADETDVGKFMRNETKEAAEARAMWICVQRVAQTVEPRLFDGSDANQAGKAQGSSAKDIPDVHIRVEEVEMQLPIDSSAAGTSRRPSQLQPRRPSQLQESQGDAPQELGPERNDAPPDSAGASTVSPQGAPPDGRKPRGRQSTSRTAKEKGE